MSAEERHDIQGEVIDITTAPSFLPRRKEWAGRQHTEAHQDLLKLGAELKQRDANLAKQARRNRAHALGMYVVHGDKK